MSQPPSIPELLNAAIADHRAGRLPQAEALYRQILAVMPNFTDALHMLGVLAYQTNRLQDAEALIAKAMQTIPNDTRFHADYAKVLTALGRHEQAQQILQTAQTAPKAVSIPAAAFNEAKAITNPKRSDGFGAQFQTIIYAAICAELAGKKFVYTPFNAMEHNYDNDPEFLRKKEELINFLGNFEIDETVEQSLPKDFFIKVFESNLDAAAASQTLKKIKQVFRANKIRPKQDGIQAAIHIRRPNSHDCRLTGSDTPDSVFVNIIHALRQNVYKDQRVSVHIYSQGAQEAFAAFKQLDNVHLHLDGPVEETFIDLVYADALVTSRSSLSYTAALLSEGQIYYLPFWHPPLKHWRVIQY